ncbi:adenylate/guanylate cyclase domain-containing protein [Novosphingobium sp.]|uniref:adenylate/guanylate cyclase domain-containing protein n=1 Tax=Novosphingobium sp. TaxID=1874826 RepID=UPI00286BBE9C|nr:adenylate/guanylate cyclase domain-containing protein [Novosphingobium sp.]
MKAPAPPPSSQRRNVAILFCDLCDSTLISGNLEPEQFAALLESLRGIFDAVVDRHGGLIVRIDGDGLLCVFGYPQPRDDAGRRATEAALDLHDAVAALDQSFGFPGVVVRLHSGIHAGTVLVREGDLVRGRVELLGDATNLAARLCDAAEADQILVSQASLGGDLHLFEIGAERAVSVKGRSAPLEALLVTGRAAVGNRFGARLRRGASPFSGRQDALAVLRQHLGAAVRGGQCQVLVWGEPGIGKSRLLREFLAEAAAAGCAVHQGYCEAYLGARPLQPFEQIAQSLRHGAALAGGDLSAQVLDWARAPPDRPAVLAIDDWQWADDASHMLLGEVLRCRREGLLVVLASRPEGAAPAIEDGIAAIKLGPLSPDESDQIITGLLRSADPFRIERIRDLAGGSPLYIEELCHTQSARLPGQGAPAGNDAGAWLEALVHKRFFRLPEDQADLVRAAAVIGHMVPLALFSGVTGVAEDDPVLAALSESDFLHRGEVDGIMRFKHALTRDAIYRTIGLDQRRQLHARVGEELERLAASAGEAGLVDALAWHHAACGSAEKAIGYAIKAGDLAMTAGALDRAQAQYRLGLEQLGVGGGGSELHRSLIGRFGRASVVDPAHEQLPVLEAAAAIARAAGDEEGLLLAEYWLGSINYGLGNAAASIHHLEAARAMLDAAARPGFTAQLLGNLGQSHAIASNYAQAKALLSQSIAAKEAASAGREPATGLAYAYASRAYVEAVQGHFSEAHLGFAAAMAALKGTFHPLIASIQSLRALGLICEHEFEASLPFIREAIEVSLLTRARYLTMSCRAVEDYALWVLSRDQRHVEALSSRIAWLTGSASRQRLSNYHGWLAEMAAETGETQRALDHYEAACRRADEGDRLGEGTACRAIARLAVQGRTPFEPRHYLDRAYASARLREAPREQFETDLCAADVFALQGDHAMAEACRARAHAGFAALGMQRRLAALTAPAGS